MFLRSARRRERQETIDRLYGAIVAQARLPDFYLSLAVPDTVEGRFDLIVLHVHLLFRRLAAESETYRAVGQAVFDRFLEDMDASLRELGVGDLGVPKRMRAMAEAFYGRAEAYEAALAAPDDEPLRGALMRNIYSNDDAKKEAAARLARYVRHAAQALTLQPASEIVSSEPAFPSPVED
jgi:cytochrome b pre-mRNA-processing protein 3